MVHLIGELRTSLSFPRSSFGPACPQRAHSSLRFPTWLSLHVTDFKFGVVCSLEGETGLSTFT